MSCFSDLPRKNTNPCRSLASTPRSLVHQRSVTRILLLGLLSVFSLSAAHAQYVGSTLYNTADNNAQVILFGVVTNDSSQLNQDSILQTVTLGTPLSYGIAVTPDPHPTRIYVTGYSDNSLWVIDTSQLGNGKVTTTNINQGNVLGLNEPDAIVIATPSVGPNLGKTIAFIVNDGNQTITTVDTATNKAVGTPIVLPSSTSSSTALSVDDPTSASYVGILTSDRSHAALAISLQTNSITDNGGLNGFYLRNNFTMATTTDGGGNLHVFRFYGLYGTSIEGSSWECNGVSGALVNQPCIAAFDSNSNGVNSPISWDASSIGCPGSGFCSVNALAAFVNTTSGQNLVTVYALVAGGTGGTNLYQVTIDCSGLSCSSPVISSPIGLNTTETTPSISLTPDDLLLYASAATSSSNSPAVVVNTTNFCLAGTNACGNASTVPSLDSTTPLRIANMDEASPPIEFLIGGPLPPAVPATEPLNILAMVMTNPANSVGMTLDFTSPEGTIDCNQPGQAQCTTGSTLITGGETFIGGSSVYSPPAGAVRIGTGPAPQHISVARPRPEQSGGNSLPPGGVVTIGLGGSSSTGAMSASSQTVSTGASCLLATSAGTVETGQTLTATLTCTAPSAENLSGTISWGDTSTPSNVTGTTASNSATLTFTHSYTTAQTYSISGSLSDLTEGNTGSVTPASVSVVVTPPPPSCTLGVSPTSVQTSQTVTGTLTCTGTAGDSLAGTVTWGDGSTASSGTATVSSGGTATISLTHQYSKASSPTYPVSATIKDSTNGLSGTVTGSPVAVTVAAAPVAPSCTLGVSPTSVQTSQTVTGTLTCTGTAGDALAGTVTWGDGSTASSGTATVSSGGTATISLTHQYSKASSPTYPVSATIKDSTNGLSGTVTGSPVAVTVAAAPVAPSCTLGVSPTSVQTSQTVTGTLTCTGTAGDALAGTVTWGDGSTASSGTATVSSGGTATISLTHQYSKASSPTYPVSATIKDSTNGLSGTVSGSPVAVTVSTGTTPPPPSCTLSASPTSATTGQSVNATLSCTAPAGDSVSGTLTWGDGSTVASMSGTANSSGAAQLQFTHAYTNSGTDSLSGTVTDTTSGLAGTVTPASLAVTINASGPTITPGQTSMSVADGQPAVYSLSFAGGASEANVTFALACQQPLPTDVGCTFSSSSLTLDSNGNGKTQVTLTTNGSAASAAARRIAGSQMARMNASFMVIPGLAFLGFGMSRRRKRGHTMGYIAMFTLLILVMVAVTGCGGGGSSMTTTPPCASCAATGTYTVTVTATSQSPALSSSTKLQLVVTP